jgi:hypothetical protein
MGKLKHLAVAGLLILLALWLGKIVLRLLLPIILVGVLLYILMNWRR